MTQPDIALIAHLMRRAGFGATREELDAYAAKGYEATVEDLLDPKDTEWLGDDMVRRFDLEASGMINAPGSARNWVYRMITTNAPLLDKMALFWHGIFATGVPKVINGRVLYDQINTFRRHGMDSFDSILLRLAKDPAMIVWLDNQENHGDAINENWARELLELFSMGVGNYTEDDIKECARAFTGWTIGNTEYMMVRSMRDSDWPYGRIAYHFDYRPEDHDDGEKTFLGQRGNFNGEDIIAIICQQDSTARFIARHLYHFFVADEPPVPAWPYTPPRDPEAIEILVRAYFDSGYDIRAVLRTLFNSDFFKSEDARYRKVKGPRRVPRRRTPHDRRIRHAPQGHDPKIQADRVDGAGTQQPTQRGGLAPGPGVDRHRHPRGENQLRLRAVRRLRQAGRQRDDRQDMPRRHRPALPRKPGGPLPGRDGRLLGIRQDARYARPLRRGRPRPPERRASAKTLRLHQRIPTGLVVRQISCDGCSDLSPLPLGEG